MAVSVSLARCSQHSPVIRQWLPNFIDTRAVGPGVDLAATQQELYNRDLHIHCFL